MSTVSPRVLVALTLGLLTAPFAGARAQGGARPPVTRVDSADALSTALDAEDKGDMKKAALAYREVLQRALIPGNSDGDKVALNVGFYYMANAGGRLVGCLLSGALFQVGGLAGCLWGTFAFALAAAVIALALPRHAAHPEKLAAGGVKLDAGD